MIYTRSESAHWYAKDGTPAHVRHGRNGGLRPTNLRDARKENLLPSVTSILKLYPSFGLRNWLNGQLVLSAHTTPRLPDETDEQWKDRVLEAADEEADIGREIGTRRHKIIERFHRSGDIDIHTEDYPFVLPYLDWFAKNVEKMIHAEQVVVHPLGYAGTLDLAAARDGRLILDVKNRKTVQLYDTDILQLAAYQHCLRPRPECISVVLGTAQPNILVREWNPLQMGEAWETFKLLLQLWKRVNNYNK